MANKAKQEESREDDDSNYTNKPIRIPWMDLVIGFLPSHETHASLREWWHAVLRSAGRHHCCAVFLALPSDKETIRYLKEYIEELIVLSENSCLIITLAKNPTAFQAKSSKPGLKERIMHLGRSTGAPDVWSAVVHEHISQGGSLSLGRHFQIYPDEFPCLVLFKDIRSREHVVVSLKKLNAEEISQAMRSTFAIIENAISNRMNPLETLQHRRDLAEFRRKGDTIIGGLRTLANESVKTAIEAFINAQIKGP